MITRIIPDSGTFNQSHCNFDETDCNATVVLPNVSSRNITQLHPLRLYNLAIMRHPKSKRIYIGQVLDIFSKAQSSRYNSILQADGTSGLSALAVRVYRDANIDQVRVILVISNGYLLIDSACRLQEPP